MSALAVAIAALLADSGVTAIVATNIYPVEAPQAVPAPYIVVNLIGESSDRHLSGVAAKYYAARVSVECISATATEMNLLGEAVKNALEGVTKQTIAGATDVDILKEASDYSGVNDTRTLKMRVMDFSVRWR